MLKRTPLIERTFHVNVTYDLSMHAMLLRAFDGGLLGLGELNGSTIRVMGDGLEEPEHLLVNGHRTDIMLYARGAS